MEQTNQFNLAKDHARWESEHGHWLKDLAIWKDQHSDAREILDSIEESLQEFADHAENHLAQIKEHQNVVKLHEDAISWRKEHPRKKLGESAEGAHLAQQEIHDRELQIHEMLRRIHHKVADNVANLADTFGLTR